MIRNFLFIITAILSVTYASANDTLRITHVLLDAPVALRSPFVTDSTTLGGSKFDAKEILALNSHLANRCNKEATTLAYGEALPSGYLSKLYFNLDAARFAKANLNVKGIKHHATYLDGAEVKGELCLKPGRHDIAILAYSPAEAKDTVRLELTSKDLSYITLNPTEGRLFDVDINVHGERYGGLNLSPSGRYVVTHYVNTLRGGETIWRTTLTDLQTKRNLYAGEYHRFNWLEHRDIVYYTRKSTQGLQLIYLDPASMTESIVASGLPDGNFTMSPDESFLIISKDNKGPKPNNALKSLYDSDDRMPGWRDRKDQYRRCVLLPDGRRSASSRCGS